MLDDLQRLEVGAEYGRRWREEMDRRIATAIAVGQPDDYKTLVAEVNSVPLAERGDWLDTFEGEQTRDDIEEVLRDAQGIDLMSDMPASRFRTFRVARPYGVANRIALSVATWATDRFARNVTLRRVIACVKEFRAFEARLERDLNSDLISERRDTSL